jgi:hypothetical protein
VVVFVVRSVFGYITDKNDNPAAGVRVKAFDNDTWPNPDDLMGITMTNSNGYYEIHYAGGHWDSAPHWWTIWRPDIFIRVSAPVNGRCEDGEWEADRNWIHLRDSSTTSNHPHRNNLRKDLKLHNYPLDSVEVHTFQRGVDMWSEVDFFFHASAFGCAPNGDKVEWTEWGFGGPPTIATRCWYPPNTQCTDADYDKIRDIGLHPYPVDYVRNALTYFVESDDVDEDTEIVLMTLLREVLDFFLDDRADRVNETMDVFKEQVELAMSKNMMTLWAGKMLIICADMFVEGGGKKAEPLSEER